MLSQLCDETGSPTVPTPPVISESCRAVRVLCTYLVRLLLSLTGCLASQVSTSWTTSLTTCCPARGGVFRDSGQMTFLQGSVHHPHYPWTYFYSQKHFTLHNIYKNKCMKLMFYILTSFFFLLLTLNICISSHSSFFFF